MDTSKGRGRACGIFVGFEQTDSMSKSKDVARAVTEILGLDYRHFTQIVMIAQEISKLLFADTATRKEIFVTNISYRKKFQQLQDALKAELSRQRSI